MPKYIVKGKTYDIPDDKVSGFETKYPDAKVEYHNDGKKYQIPLSKRGGFLKKYPNAFYGAEKPGSVSAQVIAEYDRYAGNEGHKPSALIGVTDRSTPFEPIKGFDGQDIVMSTERHLLPFEERAKLAAKDAERAANNPKNIYSTYIADKLREVDDELDKKRESLTLVPGASFIPSSAIGIAQRYGNQENKEAQDRYTSLHAAKIQLEEANKIIEAAKNNDESFLSSLGRGFKDKFFTVGNWDLGVTDIAYTSLLRKAVEKSEHDETLSPEEGRLLDAAATNMAVQGALSGQLGRGYKAGATTGASIPFMLEMIANPISGAGNAMAKGLLKYGLKRFGRIATSKAAKVAGRLAGDAVAATGMAATTGIGHVMAGAEQRMTGDINPEIKDGEIKYGGRENQARALEAYAKSAADRGIENFSEMFFNAFSGGGKVAKSFIKEYAPVLARLPKTKVGELINSIRNQPMAKALANRTQFHGIIGEHAEEIVGDLLRVPMGEASMEDITNVDKNIDTFLGLAPTSVAFGMLGLGGMAHDNYANKRNLKRFEKGLNEGEKELFSELRERILNGNDEVAKNFIKATLRNPELTPEQKKSYIFGTQELVKEKAAEDVKNDPVLEEVNREEIEANKIDTYRNYKRAERKLGNQVPSDIIPALDEDMDVDSFAKEKGLNEQQVSAINEFLDARSSYNAYEHEVNRKRNEAAASAREQAANEVKKLAHEQRGTVIEAKIDGVDGVAHIVGGNISFDKGGVLDKAHSDDTIYHLDEHGNKKMVSVENVSSVLSEIPSDELIETSVQQAIAQFDEQERASLASPDIPAPGKGERIMLDGSNYVVENVDNDIPGNFLVVKLNERGEIDPLGGIKSISSGDYYDAKEKELWGESEQEKEADQEDEPIADSEAKDVEPINMSEKELENETYPSSEESKVSEEPIEDAEQKKKRVIDSMPKKKDGAIDYDALTPQQQYEYTSVTESMEEAVKDLSEDIAERKNKLGKMESQLPNVTGAKKIKLRDAIREHRVKLNELETFYKEVAPVKGNDTSGLRNDRDYIEWVAENSDDAKELSDAYNSAKDLASHEQALMPWQKELLGRKINPDSFRRFGDRNHITGGLAKAWLNKNGEEVDTLAQELSAFGVDVSEQDIIDFVLANPGNYVSQISEDMRMLSARFSEVASKEVGMPIGGLESTTGKLYLKMKEAQVRLDALTDAQQQEFRDAVNTDAVDFIASSENDISDAYEDVITEDYARAYDETMNERGSEEADEELISKAEEGNPELYYGGFTAEELDEIYSKIENGTERQETDIVEDGIEALSENVPPTKDGGSEEINRIPNESSRGENKGIELESGGNSLNSAGDSVYLHSNQPEHENDEVPESISQGEHRTEVEENGDLEEAANQLRRRIEEASRNASESKRSGNAQQEVNRSIESQVKDSGLWTPIEKISNIGNPFLSGNENDTYLNRDEGVVYKVNNLMNSGSLPNLFNRIDFHNRFFPDTKYELVGFTGFGNGSSVYPIYKQRYIPNAEFASVEEIDDYMQSLGFRQTGEAKYSDGDIIISDLRPRNVLKDADGDIYVVDAEFAEEKNTSPEFAAPQINKGENVLDYATRIAREKEMHDVRQSVDTTPTEKQKEAGNYKKGHLKIDGYDVSIENPKGSERSGKDANGQSWSVTMNNDYGYIRGTEGVDGDQIDVFLSDNPSSGKVFVVDQVKEDGFFDEHKVMYGFDSVEEAREAYLANYSPGWKGLGSITEVSKDEFKKWVNSSKRKTKPFSGYKSVKREEAKSSDVPYSIHPSQYTTKKGKVLDMRLVTFQSELSKEQQRAAKEFAKVEKGWYDAKQGGFMMRSEESAKRLADTILNNKDALSNAQPVSLDDMRRATAPQQANTEKPISEVNNKKGNVSDQAINPSKNRLVTDERYAELRERMRKKLGGQMNIGIDPEILAIGTEMAVYHIEKGAREFKAYAKAMISDLGDAIRPYLKAFYNGARNLPEVEDGGIAIDMTPYEEVRLFDVTNFDKLGVDIIATAENLTRESSVEQEVEIAQERIKKIRSVKKETKKKNVTSQPPSEMGLFDSLFDNKTNNDNGLQRTDAERSEGVSANGNQHEQGLSRGTETGSESEQQGSRGADLGGERTGDAVDRAVRPRLSDTITEKKNTHNNHSERGKDHAPTSVDARIDANIKAIELAKLLFESGEQATEKQMQILRKFSGWGGLGKAFSEGTYYAPNHIAKQLRELLGEEAYQQAVMSANSAYYTPAYVVDTLWDIAEQMGFKGGNILEGSAGIGNILGQMPTQISEQSDIHAIEIDGTSGGILSLLYPDAKVEIQGFEQTRIANGSVDLAITNVPFVTGLRVNDTTGDKDLSKKFHNIHDFCIAKNVRKLREGGLGIFITSNGTLDSSKKLRDWIVNEGGSDFVGAFRMHNKTFGGTGVTSDIIIIRKRVNGKKSAHAIDVRTVSGERVAEYDTGDTRKVKGQLVPIVKQLSMDYNQYFIEHPENMAGEMHFAFEKGDTFRPTSKGLYPKQDKKQEQMLAEFVQSFTAEEFGDKTTDEIDVIDAMPGKKIGEVFVSDGKLYINAIGASQPLEVNANKVKGHTKVECFEAYTAIKEALAEVLEYQTNNEDDKGLKPLLAKLNKTYDDFVATYGHFNKNTAIAFLRNDVDYANVFALEKFEETADAQGHKVQKFGKTDVFSKRVVEKDKEPTPNNVKDGIIASFFKFGRVDVPYIAEQLGQSEEAVKKEIIESGYGFEDPTTRQVEVSYQYLSGNVREKLRQAQENNENGEYDSNIKALQEVVPMDIPAHLIDFALGSSWIEPKMYEEYVKERTEVGVQFTAVGGTWFMNEPYFTNYEKNRAMGVTSEMLGHTIMGHTLIEAAIQNRSITVSTVKKNWDGSTETITDKEATQACAAKIDEIRQDFKEWARQKMQSDAEMSEHMERIYNDTFNNYVPMSIPDDFVPEYFGGASHKFKMRPHQGRAIVRGTMQPLLLAHEVGTGKTFTLISTAMEMRRLGTARKPMIVVQNATVGQFVASAKELYPNAKILTLEEADRSAEGRKNFYAKIRYNDWDMIVVPQSTFEFIPDSEERQMAFVQSKIEEKMLVLEKMKEADPNGKSMITRQAEREIELLEEQLAGLSDESAKKRTAADEKKRAVALQNAEVKAMEMLDRRTDDVENFDDMGIDALLIDEAHEYKHLGFATAMQRGVKGVDPSYSKKSQGVYLKTQAVLEKNNGRNVIFATGTPISNTAAEIWTFMRYLMPADTMEEYGIYYFDDFVRNFGNIQQMLEFTTSGKFKENNRFAGYVNLPELVRIWSGVSDTVLTREAGGVSDKIPEMEGGKAQDLYLPQTRALRSIMKFVKAQLEEYDKMSGKEKKENSHIPLTMYGIAKAASVDARLVQSDAEDDAHSKTNEAVRQTLRSLKETVDYKGTVAIFADNYQNKESGFNLYEDIRSKLISESVPADEIVVIKSGMTVKKKLEIFEKVNRGEIRVILGSTFTLGTGVNIQERLHTLIHLDAPNRPMDYTQRNGRILRQGNLHKAMGKPVRVLRFGVEDSLDVTAYQRLKTKGAIADSIMNGKQMMANSMTNRVLEEEEDVFGDTVAQLSGSEYAMLKNNAEKNVRKYASRKKQWEADQTYIHNAKPRIKAFIKDAEKRIEDNSRYLEAVQSAFPDGKFTEIIIGKHRFASVEAMEDFFKDHNKSVLAEMKQMKDGEIAGEQKRELTIKIGDFSFVVTTNLTRQTVRDGATLFNDVKRKMHYSCPELGIEDIPVRQNLLRNAIEDITHNVITGRDFAERLEATQRSKKYNEAELEQLLSREGNPFEYEAELEQAQTQYEEFSELMKKELEEKEAKYAKMDADVTAADNLSTADETDELERDGDGEYNDDEVSFENDHISKVLGKSRHTRKRRREFAERERQRMVVRVETLAKKLHLDNVEVVTDASQLEGKKQRAKGFYSKSTGKITIVIPNHVSTFDVEQTLLHEAVAHYGLRQLFGEHFDTFLDNVFNSAEESVRKNISDLSATNGWDTRKATEEYLASLAENTAFENINASWWSKIKSLFLDMLHKIGFENFNGITLTDNELRYILWRSYENLAEPSRYRSILGEVKDIAKRYELNVGNYESSISRMDKASDSSDVMFREDTPSDMTREAYEESLKGQAYKAQEAYQDSMLALKRLQDVIENHSGRKLKGFENAYMDENHLSSKSHYESEVYGENFFKPMLEAVGALIKEGASYDDVVDYMMAKHGLERNEVFAMRDAENAAAKKYDKEVNALRKKFDEGELSVEEELNELIATRKDYVDSEFEKNRGKDYSGLTALTEAEDYEAAAKDIVSSFENAHDTDDLWDKVNKATKESLRKSYESGMMSKATFDKVASQFKYYIPLRGWKEDTAADIYEYFNTETSSVNPVLKFSKGRKSLADDPIAVIGNMAESTILQGNRNLMKQKFMNMAINHQSDLLSVSEAWYVKDPSSRNWVLSYPNIEDGDPPSVIAQKVSEHEEMMLEMKKEGNATKSNEGLSIDYRISKQQAKEHAVNVKRNGKDYFVYVNGNPRAAQAVNGLLNPDAENNKLFAGISRVNRQLAANFTTRNPAFVMTNLSRDLIFSTSNVLVKEDLKYSLNYIKNIEKSMRIVAGHLSGKSPNPLFEEFLSNGGEIGYTALHNIDQYKRMIKKEMRSITGKSDYMASVKACANFFSTMNRWAEDVSRFNAYMTSREAGRSVMQSISDAKEVTVNFNKKGAGYKTGGVFGVSSGLMRNLFLFFNASVQSLANFTRLAANHKKGFGVLIGGFTTAGFITPMLNGLLISLMGGDDDYYGNLTEWERRNNLCIYAGDGKFIKLPLPIELRAFYGIGEMAYQETIGNGNNGESIAYDAINQIADLLPLNPIANNGDIVTAIMPDVIKPFWQINQNKDFTGKPIYRENDFNKTMPEWTKTYRGTSKVFVDLSEWLNELGGGDKYKSGGYWADWNPAKAEHVLESYFGGMATTIVQTGKTLYAGVESAMNGKKSDNLILRNVPVINRFASDASDDKSAFSKVNSRYYRLNEEYEDTRKNLKGYIKEASTGDVKYLNKLSKLQNSKEYEVFRVFGVYKKQIDKLMKMAKDAPGGVLPQGLEDEMIRLKKEAIEKVEKIQ